MRNGICEDTKTAQDFNEPQTTNPKPQTAQPRFSTPVNNKMIYKSNSAYI